MAGSKEDKDVEMADQEKKEEEKKTEEKVELSPEQKFQNVLLANIKLIPLAVTTKDQRVIARVLRNFTQIRRQMNIEVFAHVMEAFRKGSASVLELVLPLLDRGMGELEKVEPVVVGGAQPEVEAFFVIFALVYFMDKKDFASAQKIADAALERFERFNRRSLDQFLAKVYFYYARVYELQGRLSDVRPVLLASYRTCCLHHNVAGQATLLNLILRDYLNCNLVDQAFKLVSKTSFPETRSNAQYARYLYYLGRIKAIQLEYSDSHSKLMQAIRKAPQGPGVARGFRLAATKLAVVVELLIGEIPDRTIFSSELREPLLPYFAITQAVRSGDLKKFQEVMQEHEKLFLEDKTHMFIKRLRHNVIKTGLRAISQAYSRIPLADVCKKLGLETTEEAAGVVAKAVVDGVIDATINHEQQFVESKWSTNLYCSAEPQKALHKRIAFCLQLHNDLIKSMNYPDKKMEMMTAEEQRERTQQQLAAADDEDDEMEF